MSDRPVRPPLGVDLHPPRHCEPSPGDDGPRVGQELRPEDARPHEPDSPQRRVTRERFSRHPRRKGLDRTPQEVARPGIAARQLDQVSEHAQDFGGIRRERLAGNLPSFREYLGLLVTHEEEWWTLGSERAREDETASTISFKGSRWGALVGL